MAKRPILFSGPMVRALLDGKKTMTRRVLKPQPDPEAPVAGAEFVAQGDDPGRWCWLNGFDGSIVAPFSVPYATGDRLWVREAWATSPTYDDLKPSELGGEESIRYAADGYWETWGWGDLGKIKGRNRPSMFMPRWASRLTLIVTDVRVQRLQEISEDDAKAEGVLEKPDDLAYCYGPDCPGDSARSCNKHGCWGIREEFKLLWDSLNATRGYGWEMTPWVSATTFTVHHHNIDQKVSE